MDDKLLNEFIAFCRQSAAPFADFELVEPGQAATLMQSLLPDPAIPSFTMIGKHGSNSLICRWQSDHDLTDEWPYVWLDSEGSPASVFATTTPEFLSLLPYDTGAIYDFITTWTYYLSDPASYEEKPAEKYDKERLALYVSEATTRYPGYPAFIEWLDKTGAIGPAAEPANVVGAAIENHPSLENWLTDKR
ncbi:hypothetical protein [Spirosoma areae]